MWFWHEELVGSGLHDRFFQASTFIPPRIGYTGTWIVVGIYATTMTLVVEVGLSFKTDCPLASRLWLSHFELTRIDPNAIFRRYVYYSRLSP